MGATDLFARPAVSPALELGAYEELWVNDQQSFKALAKMFSGSANDLPSNFVDPEVALARTREVLAIFDEKGLQDAGFLVHGTLDYPKALRDAKFPVQFLYFRGNLNLVSIPHRVSIVGTRNATDEGVRRARKLSALLAEDGVVIVSGLARGIDAAAHRAAIDAGGKTIAVLGTPISEYYPPENAELQEQIAREHLLISQVPVLRHARQSIHGNRLFFPERNITMSAITQATVIVEAGETSGTLIQARAALEQERLLFIMDSCFGRGLKWPERLLAKGAIRVSDYSQIRERLDISSDSNR